MLKINNFLAPYKICVLPLVKKYHQDKANEIYEKLANYFMTDIDYSGSIGKRYRRADVIGTPFCITVDDDTINNNTVTVRFRDNMKQVTINIDEIVNFVQEKIQF